VKLTDVIFYFNFFITVSNILIGIHINIQVKSCVTTMYDYKQCRIFNYSLKNQKVLRILKPVFEHLPSLVKSI